LDAALKNLRTLRKRHHVTKANVDKFVDVKAPDFNTFQQGVAGKWQKVQFKASKFRVFSTNFNKA